jgi:hypothetical protein
MASADDLVRFLRNNPGLHTYGDASEALYGHRGAGQPIGSMLRAIHNRGLHQYRVRIVRSVSDPSSHGCTAAR